MYDYTIQSFWPWNVECKNNKSSYLLLSLDKYSANILTAWSSGLELALMSSRTTAYFLYNNKNPFTLSISDSDRIVYIF